MRDRGEHTGKPSPGRTVTGEMPDLDGVKCYTGNGDAPLALRSGRERVMILGAGEVRELFLATPLNTWWHRCRILQEGEKALNGRAGCYGMQIDAASAPSDKKGG